MKWKKIVIRKQEDAIPKEETEGGILPKENGMMKKTEEVSQEELDTLREACLNKLTDIMSRWVSDYFIEQTCKAMLDDMPKALHQNIWEWIEDKPISEVIVGDLSINQVMEANKIDFISATKLMMKYVRWGCLDSDKTFILMYQAILRS